MHRWNAQQATSPAAERRYSEWDALHWTSILPGDKGQSAEKNGLWEMRETGPLPGGLKGFAVCGLRSDPAHVCPDPE